MKTENKQDVIKWLKDLKREHPLSSDECLSIDLKDYTEVFTDGVIRKTYQHMIAYLESDEVK